MRKLALMLPILAAALHAEVHYMTLRQAVELALKQNPDIILARLDEQKAIQSVRVARDEGLSRSVSRSVPSLGY